MAIKQTSLQAHISHMVIPSRLKYKGGVRAVATEAICIVMCDCTPQEAKSYFNYLIDDYKNNNF